MDTVVAFHDLASYRVQHDKFRRLPDPQRREGYAALRRATSQWVVAFSSRWIERALAADDPLPSAMEWFWFNHFNVFWRKDPVGAALPDYVEAALRPATTGRFRDLLLGVMIHPAMLAYLDNARNVAGKGNENFARELLELHTLGVDGGYRQGDVQEVARVLTGVGLRPLQTLDWPAALADKVRERGEFLFDPRRHDFSDKQVLGRTIAGSGFAEVETLADMLAGHPATARHVARRLCLFFWGEDASATKVADIAKVFHESQGDLGRVVQAIRLRIREEGTAAAPSFKSPLQWVMSSLRLLAGDAGITNVRPLLPWLTQLGQPLFGRSTPDGYSLRGRDWISSGQMAQRFNIAREMVARMPAMLGERQAAPWLAHAGLEAALQGLSQGSRAAIERADEPAQRAMLIISSPEFMYRRPGEDML